VAMTKKRSFARCDKLAASARSVAKNQVNTNNARSRNALTASASQGTEASELIIVWNSNQPRSSPGATNTSHTGFGPGVPLIVLAFLPISEPLTLQKTLDAECADNLRRLSRGNQFSYRFAGNRAQLEAHRAMSSRQRHILPAWGLAQNGATIRRPGTQPRPDLDDGSAFQRRRQSQGTGEYPGDTSRRDALIKISLLNSCPHKDGIIDLRHKINIIAKENMFERWLRLSQRENLSAHRANGNGESQPLSTLCRPRSRRNHQMVTANHLTLRRLHAYHPGAIALNTHNFSMVIEACSHTSCRTSISPGYPCWPKTPFQRRIDGSFHIVRQSWFALASLFSRQPGRLNTQRLPERHLLA